jgi:hypothetical protein
VGTLDAAHTPARMDEIRAAMQPLVGARGAVTAMASTGVLGPSDVIELLDEIERLTHERTYLADAIVSAGIAAGIIDGTKSLTGAQLLLVADDVRQALIDWRPLVSGSTESGGGASTHGGSIGPESDTQKSV